MTLNVISGDHLLQSHSESEPHVCPLHEIFTECGSACPDTCDNYEDQHRICTLQCVKGCFCEKGYVRNKEGACVLLSNCPGICHF